MNKRKNETSNFVPKDLSYIALEPKEFTSSKSRRERQKKGEKFEEMWYDNPLMLTSWNQASL